VAKKKKRKAGKKSAPKRLPGKVLKWTGIVVLSLITLSVLKVIVYRFVNPPVTLLMISRSFEKTDKTRKVKRQWTPYEKISQPLIDAVIASEDNRFVAHSGFDFEEMQKVYRENKAGKRLRGASTITQQMCKNVFLWEKRSYTRKILEGWYTVLVELFWSKKRIMEVYLNVIEMGNGIYGIDAAARTYYQKSAGKLSREEAAMIAICLPSPRKRNPTNPTPYMLKRQEQILNLMNKIGTVKL
jgi:monofunctional biosynthetic peptidoglycan transglycosylase